MESTNTRKTWRDATLLPCSGGKLPDDAAFLAMTHWRLGNHDRARQELERLRGMLQSSGDKTTAEHRNVLREAEAMIAPRPVGPS